MSPRTTHFQPARAAAVDRSARLREHGIRHSIHQISLELPREVWFSLKPLLPRSITRPVIDTVAFPDEWQQGLFKFVVERPHQVEFFTRAYGEVSQLLRRAGYQDLPQLRVHEEYGVPVMLEDVDDRLHAGLRQTCFGQLIVDKAADGAEMVVNIVKMFPEGRFLIPVSNCRAGESLAGRLSELLHEEVAFLRGLEPRGGTRVAVAMPWAARKLNELEYGGLVIPMPTSGMTNWVRELTRCFELDRCYVIRPRQQRVPRSEIQEWLYRLGPVIFDTQVPRRTVSTYSIVRFGGHAQAAGLKRGGRTQTAVNKRSAYWQHEARNRLIARLAQELSESPLTGTMSSPKVAVLVETLAHARSLGELLPGWAMHSQAVTPAVDASTSITTLTAAAATTSWHADVVVVAGGGGASKCLKAICERSSSAMRLVDLTDEFSPDAAAAATSRAHAYQKSGLHHRPLQDQLLKRCWRALRVKSDRNQA